MYDWKSICISSNENFRIFLNINLSENEFFEYKMFQASNFCRVNVIMIPTWELGIIEALLLFSSLRTKTILFGENLFLSAHHFLYFCTSGDNRLHSYMIKRLKSVINCFVFTGKTFQLRTLSFLQLAIDGTHDPLLLIDDLCIEVYFSDFFNLFSSLFIFLYPFQLHF